MEIKRGGEKQKEMKESSGVTEMRQKRIENEGTLIKQEKETREEG